MRHDTLLTPAAAVASYLLLGWLRTSYGSSKPDMSSHSRPDFASGNANADIIEVLSSGDEVETVEPVAKRHHRDLDVIMESTSKVRNIVWDLCPGGHNPLSHIHKVVELMLQIHAVSTFIIGITYAPLKRWTDERFGYKQRGFRELRVVAHHDDADVIAQLERQAIEKHRRYNPSGYLVNAAGHLLCGNRNPGGESASHGVAPHFLYVAVRC